MERMAGCGGSDIQMADAAGAAGAQATGHTAVATQRGGTGRWRAAAPGCVRPGLRTTMAAICATAVAMRGARSTQTGRRTRPIRRASKGRGRRPFD